MDALKATSLPGS